MHNNNKSFFIADDDDDDEIDKRLNGTTMSNKSAFGMSQRESLSDLLDSDSDEGIDSSPQRFINAGPELTSQDSLSHVNGIRQKISSAGPSGRQTVTKLRSPISQQLSSDSDSESEGKKNNNKSKLLGEYDPKAFLDLDVGDEVRELFQYITKYIPQNLSLDFKFKPFIPDYIPAVGDIDAFLKVVPPDVGLSGEAFALDVSHLGLTVLDEPSSNQSDPALLHLQLRASSVNAIQMTNIVVKKVDNVEKNAKTIDKWIKDMNDLHKSKTSPIVKYSNPMPDLDDLMQEWPETIENLLKIHGFPNFKFCQSLSQYINIVCSIFDIPIHKNKIQSLHLLFSLYAAVKNSQLYQVSNDVQRVSSGGIADKFNSADQLVLE